MRNVESKKNNKKARILVTFIVFSIFCIILLISIIKMGSKLVTLYENKKAVDEKLANLESQKANLLESTKNLSTDSGIEENLRDKYFIAKEGESLVVIVEEEEEIKEEDSGSFGFIKKFFSLFKKD